MENDVSRPQMTVGANDEPVTIKKPNNIPAILLGVMLVGAVYQLVGTQFLPKKAQEIAQAGPVQSNECAAINAPQKARELTKHGLRPTIDETSVQPGC